ncbi:hypothetical protein [Flavihumibacter sp.]|uniref:hypothetical protein n=1 Tax=Flavihumibacter sp. TaxID=1913981 RepID=UPI002FC929B8
MTENRSILTIAPLLADDFVDLDGPNFDSNKYSIFLDENANRLGSFKKYLICKLHDSAIIDIRQEFDKLSIILNDYSTCVFAKTLIERYNLPIGLNNISFPLKIEFEGNLNVEYNKVDDNGNLISISRTDLDEYLYEQVTQIDKDKIEIVFHFWKTHVKANKHGKRIIAIVSAKNLTLIENQDKVWTEVFGHEYDELYMYFKEQFNSDRYVSDHAECEKLIDDFDQSKKPNKNTI